MRLHRRTAVGLSAGLVAIVLVGAFGAPAGWALTVSSPALAGSVSDNAVLPGATSVATSGSYAYTTAYSAGRLTAIDLHDIAHPAVAGETASSSTLLNASTVNIAGGYAFVASKNRNGPRGSNSNDDGTGNSLTIVDIATNPAQPAVAGSVRDPVDLFGAYGVAVSGNYAYVAAQGCLSGQPCPNPNVGDSFAVVDVTWPASPTVVATLRNSNLPAPWTGSQALKHASSVAISGTYAYVTAAYSNRLTVIDISNPLGPQIVASIQDSSRLAFAVDVAVQGGYAYVTDQSSGLGRVAVVDVHDPTSPTIVATVTNSTWLNGAYRIRLHGDFAYVSATYSDAVSAIDVSDPTKPRFVGGFADGVDLNRTTGLDLDSSGRFLVASSPFAPSETNPLYPPYPFQSGGTTLTGTVTVVDLDPSPIAVAIDSSSEPASPTSQTWATFAFTVSDAVSSVRCRLDGASLAPCTSPTTQAYAGLTVGSHTFTVQATDAAGNVAADSYSWQVDPVQGPVTGVLDDFGRADGGVGSSWSVIKSSGFAAMKIVAGVAVDSSSSQYAWNFWNPAGFGPDCEAFVTVASSSGSDTVRVGARVSGGGTGAYSGYFVSVSAAGVWSIVRVDSGSAVTLVSGVTQALAAGDRLAIRVVGSTVSALHWQPGGGWVQLLGYDTASDAVRYTQAGDLAVEFKTSTIDDFGGGTYPAAPANVSLPVVGGAASATVGQQLTASPVCGMARRRRASGMRGCAVTVAAVAVSRSGRPRLGIRRFRPMRARRWSFR